MDKRVVLCLWCLLLCPSLSSGSSYCGATPRTTTAINGLAFIGNFTVDDSTVDGAFELHLDSINGPCSLRGVYRYVEANQTYLLTPESSNGTCPSPAFSVSSAVRTANAEILLIGTTNTPDGGSLMEWELAFYLASCGAVIPVDVYCTTAFDVSARVIVAPARNFTLEIDASDPCAVSGRYELVPSSSAPSAGAMEVDVVVFLSSCASYLTFGSLFFSFTSSNVPQINISGALLGIPWNAIATPAKC